MTMIALVASELKVFRTTKIQLPAGHRPFICHKRVVSERSHTPVKDPFPVTYVYWGLLLHAMLDLEATVDPSNLTLGSIAKCIDGKDELWGHLRSTAQLIDVNVQPITGNGYVAVIKRIAFLFEGPDRPFSVILKVRSLCLKEVW